MKEKKLLDNSLFNIDTLTPKLYALSSVKPVTSLNIFRTGTREFDVDGLFSTDIFGAVGSSDRVTKYGRIDLHCSVFHPMVFTHLCSMNSLYRDVMSCKTYAVYDEKIRDLVPVDDEDDGQTGLTFFQSVVEKLDFKETGSDQRLFRTELIQNNDDRESLLTAIPVLEAGLRDYNVDDAGVASEDAINDLYRKLLMATDVLKNYKSAGVGGIGIEKLRFRVQTLVTEVFDYIVDLLNGKNKYIQGKFSKRTITHGTRNVLSSFNPNIADLRDTSVPGHNNTIIGLFQYVASVRPIVLGRLRRIFIDKIMSENTELVPAFNAKTLKPVNIVPSRKAKSKWLSYEGTESIMMSMVSDVMKSHPVKIDDNYMCLVEDNGSDIKLYYGGVNPDKNTIVNNLRPLTYYELFHLAIIFDDVASLETAKYNTITRYPITWQGSIYASEGYIETTLRGRSVTITDINGKIYKSNTYNSLDGVYFRGMAMNRSKLSNSGADMDGDMSSANSVMIADSQKEIKDHLASKATYLRIDGEFVDTMSNTTIELTINHMTDGKLSLKRFENKIKSEMNDDVITVDEYLTYCRSVSFLEQLSMLFVVAGTEKTLLPLPNIKEIKKNLSEEFSKKYGPDWYTNESRTIEYVTALNKLDDEWRKDDPTTGKLMANGKMKVSRSNRQVSLGVIRGFGKSAKPTFVANSLSEGIPIDKEQLAASFNSSRAGSYDRGKETQAGGSTANDTLRAMAGYTIEPNDCGSKIMRKVIYDRKNKQQQSYINTKYTYSNGKLVTVGELDLADGVEVSFRTQEYCKNPGTSYCEICCGKLTKGYKYAIPLQAAQIGGILLTIPMKSMHGKESKVVKLNIHTVMS